MTNYYSRDAGLRNAQLKAKRKRQPLRRGCVLRRKQERLSAPRLFGGVESGVIKIAPKNSRLGRGGPFKNASACQEAVITQ